MKPSKMLVQERYRRQKKVIKHVKLFYYCDNFSYKYESEYLKRKINSISSDSSGIYQWLCLVNKSYNEKYKIHFDRNEKQARHENTKLTNSQITTRLCISLRAEAAQREHYTAMAPPQNQEDPVVIVMPLVILMAGKTMVTVTLTVMTVVSLM